MTVASQHHPDNTELHQLFRHIAEGDLHAYRKIYDLYYARIYQLSLAYARISELAEDTAQLVFLKLWERRAELATVEQPENWLFTAAKYQVWKLLEKEMSQESYRVEIFRRIDAGDWNPIIQMNKDARHAVLRSAVASLTDKQRDVYTLGREQGFTYLEIAEKLSISRETVKDRMTGALTKIKAYLLKHKDELFWLMINLQIFF